MIKRQFVTGGYAVHKIQGDFKGVVSAWYDGDGNLLDTEQRLPGGQMRAVKRGGPIWRLCQKIGQRYK